MKKKILTALMAAMMIGGAAQAMDSATLMETPARYSVLFADADRRIYADLDTVSAMQTMDYPGSIENVSFTLYAEVYKEHADVFDFSRGDLIREIREFKVELYADRRERHYGMKLTPVLVYNAKGDDITKDSGDFKLRASAKELYYNLAHVLHLGQDWDNEKTVS